MKSAFSSQNQKLKNGADITQGAWKQCSYNTIHIYIYIYAYMYIYIYIYFFELGSIYIYVYLYT